MSKEKKDIPKLRHKQFKKSWEKKKINKMTEYITSSLSANNALSQGKYELYDANKLTGFTNIKGQSQKYVTIIKDGSGVGRVRLLPERTNFIGTMGAIINKNKVNIHYIYAYLQKFDFTEYITGATVPHVYYRDYGEAIDYHPSYQEQNKIGSIFKLIDEMIQLQQSKVKKIKDIKSAYLSEMFPTEGEKYPKKRFEGFTEPWETMRFNEITEYFTSSLSANNALIKGEYELYDANELVGYTNESGQKNEYVTIIKDGSGVGRVRLLPKNSNFIGTMGAIVNKEKIDVNYIYAYLQQFNFTEFITGATVPHVYYRDYGESTDYHPSYEEQVKIGQLFKNLDNQITNEEEKLTKLEKLKQAYLNDMFV